MFVRATDPDMKSIRNGETFLDRPCEHSTIHCIESLGSPAQQDCPQQRLEGTGLSDSAAKGLQWGDGGSYAARFGTWHFLHFSIPFCSPLRGFGFTTFEVTAG